MVRQTPRTGGRPASGAGLGHDGACSSCGGIAVAEVDVASVHLLDRGPRCIRLAGGHMAAKCTDCVPRVRIIGGTSGVGPAPGLVDLRRPGAENDHSETAASSPGPRWSMFAATRREATTPTRRHHRGGSGGRDGSRRRPHRRLVLACSRVRIRRAGRGHRGPGGCVRAVARRGSPGRAGPRRVRSRRDARACDGCRRGGSALDHAARFGLVDRGASPDPPRRRGRGRRRSGTTGGWRAQAGQQDGGHGDQRTGDDQRQAPSAAGTNRPETRARRPRW
jgi:hypothetical protein